MNALRQHFALTRIPFSYLDPCTPFESADYTAVAQTLPSVLLTGGIALCAGEPGAGKTFAVDAWTQTLNPNEVTVQWLDDPGDSVPAFLRRSVRALGIAPAYRTEAVWQQLVDAVGEHFKETARHLLFVIDEAQEVPPAVLEQLRRMTNLGRRRPLPLSYVLIAHRDFLAPLGQQHLTAFRRRLRTSVSLGGLGREEIEPYVAHHLAQAGCNQPLLGDDALDLLWSASRGLPRLVGTLALSALVQASQQGQKVVEPSVMRRAVDHMQLTA